MGVPSKFGCPDGCASVRRKVSDGISHPQQIHSGPAFQGCITASEVYSDAASASRLYMTQKNASLRAT